MILPVNISIGTTLSGLRRGKKLKQKDVAFLLGGYGFDVKPKTIYNWEKGLSQPGIPHFIALCDILDVDDVLWRFAGIEKGPYAGLNSDGRRKAREFIDLLFHIDAYRSISGNNGSPASKNTLRTGDIRAFADGGTFWENPVLNEDGNTEADFDPSGKPDVFSPAETGSPRLLRLYDIPVSAGTGNFLGDSSYEMIEAPSYVPVAVDFALRVSGDSMEPLLQDGQVIWVKEQELLDNGEIGIFTYSDDVYCKKLIADGARAYLRSLNPGYDDIEIKDDFGFRVIGKVVS